jgi:hypothetical protein
MAQQDVEAHTQRHRSDSHQAPSVVLDILRRPSLPHRHLSTVGDQLLADV